VYGWHGLDKIGLAVWALHRVFMNVFLAEAALNSTAREKRKRERERPKQDAEAKP
jgi:hypothetical protein